MVSDVITKAHGKDKVIDFRNGLVPALPEHYASIHQAGGRKSSGGRKTFSSVIKMYLCDFAKGTGDKSVTVSVNLEPSLCYEWLEVCKASLGQIALPYYDKVKKQGGSPYDTELRENSLGRMRNDLITAGSGAVSFVTMLQGVVSGLADIVRGKISDKMGACTAAGAAMKKAKGAFSESRNRPAENVLTLARGIDYSYTQDKVNVYKKGKDGYAPVSRLLVTRQTFRTDGSAAMYPWTFKITNGEAVVVERDNGATTFQSNTMRNSSEAFILVSDRDVFRMMLRVTHFIDAWETAYGIPVICNGIQLEEQERQNQINSST